MRVHQYDAERVIDFMCDAGGQLTHAREFLGLHERFLGGSQLFVRFLEFAVGLAESIDGVGEAHFVFREPAVDGDGMFAAGFVAAGAAVQFIFRVRFAQLGENLLQGLRVRLGNALITGGEPAVQGNRAAGGELFLPRSGRESGHATRHVLGHPTSAKEQRLLARHTGTHDAAFAAEDLEQLHAQVAIGELLDDLAHMVTTLGRDDFAGHQVFAESGGLQGPATDRIECAGATVRRIEVGGLRRLRGIVRRGQQVAQFAKSQDRIDFAAQVLVVRFVFLGDARTDEDDFQVALLRAEVTRQGHHGGHDGSKAVDQIGVVPLDITDDGRTGGRNVLMPVGVGQQFPVRGGHEVRTEGHFMDRAEPECLDASDELLGIDIGELGGKAGSDTRRHLLRGLQQLSDLRDRTHGLFGVLRAHFHAVAAGNAPFGDNARLPILDPNGLGRAFPHARVADTAAFRDRVDECRSHGEILLLANQPSSIAVAGRLSLRERAFFRGAKDDTYRPSPLGSSVLHKYFGGMVVRMQQFVAALAQRLPQVLVVQTLDRGVAVRDADGFLSVDGVERFHPLLGGQPIHANGLTTAGDAATRAGHDFDEVQVIAAGADFLEQPIDVAHAVDDGDTELDALDVQVSFLVPRKSADRFHVEVRQFLAGEQEVRGTNRGFHHAAGGTEDLAGRRAFAKGRIGLFGRHVLQVNATPADQAGQFPRGEHGIDVGNSVSCHFRPGGLELLGRAGHDAHAEDAGWIDAGPLGEEALDHGTHHLLRALAGGQVVEEVGVERLDIADPAGRATGEHRQLAPGLDAVNQLRRFLHDRQIGGEAGVEHALEADAAERRGHASRDVDARRQSELLAERHGDARSVLGHDEHVWDRPRLR